MYATGSRPKAALLIYIEPDSLADQPMPLTIGDENNHLYTFDGLIDEVRLYNRALSDAEIWALWCADR